MKSDTVKPKPPKKPNPNRDLLCIPIGMGVWVIHRYKREKSQIPSGLPIISPNATAEVTPHKSSNPTPLKRTPALTKAKSGKINQFTPGVSCASIRCMGLTE